MAKPLKHPTMQNQSYRYAILCLTARLLLTSVQDTFPSFQPGLIAGISAIFTIVTFTLMIVAYCIANRGR